MSSDLSSDASPFAPQPYPAALPPPSSRQIPPSSQGLFSGLASSRHATPPYSYGSQPSSQGVPSDLASSQQAAAILPSQGMPPTHGNQPSSSQHDISSSSSKRSEAHLPRAIQNQTRLPWTASRLTTPFDAAKALIDNAVNSPLDVVDVIVILDKGGFGGMTVGCKYSEGDYRILPNDYDSFFGTLCLPGWSAAANIDNFCRGNSLAQICELTKTGLVIQYNQYTHVVTPDIGVQVAYDNTGVARQDTIANTPKNTFWVFVPPIQPIDDYPISHLESQESIAEYMLRQSIEHNKISFRLDLDSNPDLNYLLGRRNLFDIPSIPKVTGPKQALHQLIYYKSEYPNQYPLELVQHLCPWLIWEQIPLNEQEGDVASISFVSTTPLVQLSNPNAEWFPLQPILVIEGYFQQDFIGLRDALKNVWQRSRPAHLHQIKDPHIMFYLRINRQFLGLANHKGDLELTLGNDVAKNLRDLITSTISRHLRSSFPKPSSWVEGLTLMRDIDPGKLNEYKVQNDEYILNPSSPVARPFTRRYGVHSS
ncbi:hypothetical protein KCU73_g4857, partial [Aureobasidium melanogenum]